MRPIVSVAAVVLFLASCSKKIDRPQEARSTAPAPTQPTAPVQSLAPTAAKAPEKVPRADRPLGTLSLLLGKSGADEAMKYGSQFARAAGYPETLGWRCVASLATDGVSVKEMDRFLAAAGDSAAMGGDKDKDLGVAVIVLGHAKKVGFFYLHDLTKMNIGVDHLRKAKEYSKRTDAQLQSLLTGDETISMEQLFHLIALAGPEPTNLGDLAVQSAGVPD